MAHTTEKIKKCIADSYEIPNRVVESMPQPVVTVRTSTYNHGPYIKECIESIINQKTDFPFEFIIGEDFSTDETRGIVMEYAERYPELIRVITADYNVGSKANGARCARACRGKYMAICEGDDYWVDEKKLAKQVAILEREPNVVLCCSAIQKIDESGGKMASGERAMKRPKINRLYEVLEENFVATCSVLFRMSTYFEIFNGKWRGKTKMGDWPLWMMLTTKGDIHYTNEILAAYRIHEGGVWSSATSYERDGHKAEALELMRNWLPKYSDTASGESLYRIRMRMFMMSLRQRDILAAKEMATCLGELTKAGYANASRKHLLYLKLFMLTIGVLPKRLIKVVC